MTPEEWMNKNYGTGRTLTNTNNNLPAVKYHPNGRKSKLTKYAREVMILEIAEMILKGTERSIIVDVLHKKYNYSLQNMALNCAKNFDQNQSHGKILIV